LKFSRFYRLSSYVFVQNVIKLSAVSYRAHRNIADMQLLFEELTTKTFQSLLALPNINLGIAGTRTAMTGDRARLSNK